MSDQIKISYSGTPKRSRETNADGLSLHTADGARKYLDASERGRFIATAGEMSPSLRTLCLTLVLTGCRISEALALSPASLFPSEGVIAFRSLKKRTSRVIMREMPVPAWLLSELLALSREREDAHCERLWHWGRVRAWQLIKSVMAAARIGPGPYASPKGLRHGFGMHAVRSGVPLNLVQRWLGHARMETTAIYLQAVGDEERQLASRMWRAGTSHPRDIGHRRDGGWEPRRDNGQGRRQMRRCHVIDDCWETQR